MHLNLPKKITFWISVVIAAVSLVLYIIHLLVPDIGYLGAAGYAVLAIAFVLLYLGLTIKGL